MRKLSITILIATTITWLALPAHADNIGAAGDISSPPGGSRSDANTARLLGNNGVGLVLTLGDNQYEAGEYENFLAAYDLSWGQYLDITRPSPGNHEYINPATSQYLTPTDAEGAGYYRYFEGRTPPHPGNYSFNYQGWHFVSINTTFSAVPGGVIAVRDWLKADLQANRDKKCTVVYGHHPYKGSHTSLSNTPDLRHIWPTLVLEDVDLYIAGHQHAYERTKPFRTSGAIDYDHGPGDGDDGHMGVRTITAGTGGRSLIPFNTVFSASAYRLSSKFGIFKIVPDYAAPNSFLTAFKGIDGSTHDRVAWGCH